MNLKSLFTKFPTDQPLEEQRLDKMPGAFVRQLSDRCAPLPGTQGRIGDRSSPIPVNGVLGEVLYLNRLASPSGCGYFYHRIGSEPSIITRSHVDVYELLSVDGADHRVLYLCPYYDCRSLLAPAGTKLRPWPNDEAARAILKAPFGTNQFVPEFPFGLPRVIPSTYEAMGWPGGIGTAVAKKLAAMLDSIGSTLRSKQFEFVKALPGGRVVTQVTSGRAVAKVIVGGVAFGRLQQPESGHTIKVEGRDTSIDCEVTLVPDIPREVQELILSLAQVFCQPFSHSGPIAEWAGTGAEPVSELVGPFIAACLHHWAEGAPGHTAQEPSALELKETVSAVVGPCIDPLAAPLTKEMRAIINGCF